MKLARASTGQQTELSLSRDEKCVLIAANVFERASSSSPRDAGVGRGSRRGASSWNVPPLPVPLLHPMEERELLRLQGLRDKVTGSCRAHVPPDTTADSLGPSVTA